VLIKEKMKKSKDYRKILVNLGKDLIKCGLTYGSGGNISIREGNFIYIKASGAWFKEAKKRDYLKISLEAGRDYKKTLKPSCELKMHISCYRRRKDINCIIHSHSTYAIIFANKYKELKPVTAEFAAILEDDVPVLKYLNPASDELAEKVADRISKHNGLILSNHGVVTVGRSPKEALYRAVLIENETKIVLLSDLFTKAKYLNKKVKDGIIKSVHSEYRRKRLEKR